MSALMTDKTVYEGKPRSRRAANVPLSKLNGCDCRAVKFDTFGVWVVQIRIHGEGWRDLETVTLPDMRHPAACQCKTCGMVSSYVSWSRECPSCAIDRQAEAAAELEAAGIPLGWGHCNQDRIARLKPEAIREEAVQRGWKPKRAKTTKG